MNQCGVSFCKQPAEGFVCADHWKQLPHDLRREVRDAANVAEQASHIADQFPTRRPARVVADAKRTAYTQVKHRAVHWLERHSQSQPEPQYD